MKVQDYIDPNKAENEIKENTKLDIPLIAAAPVVLVVAPIAPAAAPIALVATPTALVAAPTALVATLASTRTAIPVLLNQ